MLTSLALIFLTGLLLGAVCGRLGLPRLVGMLLAGIVLGPHALNLLAAPLLAIAADLRQLALVIILLRAGLALDVADLRRAGRPAVLLCFVPALFELCACLLLAPLLFGFTLLEAAILGSVIAAVSPAVIVPRMLKLMEEGRGTAKAIPQMILAGASLDDVFVIVLFTAFTGIAAAGGMGNASVAATEGVLSLQNGGGPALQIALVPVSILLGAAGGALCGLLLAALFKRVHMRDTAKVLLLLSTALLLAGAGDALAGRFPFSGLVAAIALGIACKAKRSPPLRGGLGCLATPSHPRAAGPSVAAVRLSAKFNRLWVAAEILLFVLVGAAVDVRYTLAAGGAALLLLAGGLALRWLGVFACLIKTRLTKPERLFCAIAYSPKATVQAAIGAVPLAMGLPCGETVLAVAVLAILVSAPLGALAIDKTSRHLLQQDSQSSP